MSSGFFNASFWRPVNGSDAAPNDYNITSAASIPMVYAWGLYNNFTGQAASSVGGAGSQLGVSVSIGSSFAKFLKTKLFMGVLMGTFLIINAIA